MTDAEIAGIMGWRGPGCYTEAQMRKVHQCIEQAVTPYREDAERWRAIRPHYCAADFFPEREDGLDLGKGIALIFLMPQGLRVSGDADQTIDTVRKGGV